MQQGIFPPFEAFYIEAMLWHTSSAIRSANVVGKWIRLVEEDDERALELPKAGLFEELQNILHQAGIISRYFFPAARQSIHQDRANTLRAGLGVEDNNILSNRDLRNAIEHFDERLDKYLTRNIVGQIIPVDVALEPPVSEVPLHIFKAFYVNERTFVLLGESYAMPPIVEELRRLHKALTDCADNGHRLPR